MRITRHWLTSVGLLLWLAPANREAPFTLGAQAGCTFNPVVCENQLPGAPAADWDVSGAGDPSIQGFATSISVDQGQTVRFKIASANSFRMDIYRLGYYSGSGARKVATVTPTAAAVQLARSQPQCLTRTDTGLIDCGNWSEIATWLVPVDAVSGIYLAKLIQAGGGDSHIVFIVRDDDGRSDLLFQTSDTTWQAYNAYGGNSLYVSAPSYKTLPGRAFKVSYNRPFTTRGNAPEDWLFNAEYPMLRWLEANGFNVSYTTGSDTDRRGAELLEHKVFLSVGHDEYWSGGQRASAEAARNQTTAPVHLAFFSGNEVFWKTRWENSIDSSNTPYRTLVSYKETHANAKIDPLPGVWTGTWRDPRFSPPADGGRPENALTGTIFMVNDGATGAIKVPAEEGRHRFWRGTSVSSLPPGGTATLAPATLGYEWDEDLDNGFRPAGLMRMSSTTVTNAPRLQDYGSTYGSGTATHSLTLYRHSSGALVFGAGTVQWSWGLDGVHDRCTPSQCPPSVIMQQATVNLFADMGAQPQTPQAGLTLAAASTDIVAPATSITSPAAGSSIASGSQVTISGTATDGGGGVVTSVEVSVDGGASWRRATGRASWSFSWTPTATGPVTIRSRGVDDSGNIESPGDSVQVTVGTRQCPCSLWNSGATPQRTDADTSAVELGVRFQSDVDGYITAIRYYRTPTNTGPHKGNLWTATGTLLASVTFSNETASGWQQATLPSPVQIAANTIYVASYHSPAGLYAVTSSYFSAQYDNAPLHAPASGNGVYRYGATSAFPNQTFQSENYWADVVFQTTTAPPGPDTTPPTVQSVVPANAATGVSPAGNVTATFSEAMDPATTTSSTFELRDPANALVASTVTYDAASRTATLDPTQSLAGSTTYTARVRGGTTDPRAKDQAGNALANTFTWSFTTAAPSSCPCSLWSSSTVPASTDPDTGAVELGVRFQSAVDGNITALRFYKSANNTGTHVGHLWTATGTLVATVTFAGETASGWQQATLATPVAVTANTVYVASYHTTVGRYSVNTGYFNSAYSNQPLSAPATANGGNGVYRYGTSGTFPNETYQGSNYWVDVVFTPR
jgi:hypothetical protein